MNTARPNMFTFPSPTMPALTSSPAQGTVGGDGESFRNLETWLASHLCPICPAPFAKHLEECPTCGYPALVSE